MSKFENIFDAAREGTVEDIKYLIEEKGIDVNSIDENGRTPLHHISYIYIYGTENIPNAIQKIQFLVSVGADINAENNDGETPLHLAVRGVFKLEDIPKVLEIVKCLISVGADVNKENKDGCTPLNFARFGNGRGTKAKLVDYLENNGANPGSLRKKNPTGSGIEIGKIIKYVVIGIILIIIIQQCVKFM